MWAILAKKAFCHCVPLFSFQVFLDFQLVFTIDYMKREEKIQYIDEKELWKVSIKTNLEQLRRKKVKFCLSFNDLGFDSYNRYKN